MDTKSTITLPPPPLCAPHPGNIVHVGEDVVVNLQDGSKLTGALADFQMKNGVLLVRTHGADVPQRVELPTIKTMHLPTPRQWIRAEVLGRNLDDPTAPPVDKQTFDIKFKDGGQFEGETLGFRTDRNGLYLFPIQSAERYIYTFIPHAAVAHQQIGPRIGELLVEQRLVNADEVKSALDAQKEQRERPIGAYLRSTAVVSVEDLERALEHQKSAPNMKLGEILISEKLISEDQLEAALEAQRLDRKMPLGEMLVEQGLVTTTDIQQALAKKLGIPFVDLHKFQIDESVLKLVPEDLVRKHRVLPLYIYKGKLVVAVENPMAWEPLDAVRFHTNLYAEPVMASIEDIERAITAFYQAGDLADIEMDDFDDNFAPANDQDATDEASVSDNVVVKLVNKMIVGAYHKGASDIHIEPYAGGSKTVVRIRKDGTLLQYHEVPAKLRNAIVARIKIMCGLDIAEKRKPQDGKIDFKRYSRLKIELRVATIPTVGGQEDVVMRILASGAPIPLPELGLTEANRTGLTELVAKPYGLFLVAGPTGSGKTTSLHSILAHLNTPDRKIWTAEDPVEITQKGLRQLQVLPKIGLTFAAAMRAFLRADPDIIMVGEMRDLETTKMGIEASLTGHLVLSTLHTNSAPESIVRLLEMGMDPFNFSDALLGVLAQRLAKSLCPSCKKPHASDDKEIEALANEYCMELDGDTDQTARDKMRAEVIEGWRKQFGDDKGKITLHQPGGCDECDDTGYAGRVGIHELLIATDKVKHLILNRAQVMDLRATALAEGMRTLKQDGIDKVLQGLTDMQQIRRVCIK